MSRVYPIMNRLVCKFFLFVTTSVPSEHLFSAADNVITEKRNCLTPEHADQLIFLFVNCQFVTNIKIKKFIMICDIS